MSAGFVYSIDVDSIKEFVVFDCPQVSSLRAVWRSVPSQPMWRLRRPGWKMMLECRTSTTQRLVGPLCPMYSSYPGQHLTKLARSRAICIFKYPAKISQGYCCHYIQFLTFCKKLRKKWSNRFMTKFIKYMCSEKKVGNSSRKSWWKKILIIRIWKSWWKK